jgi:hypothetical protein
MEQLDEGARERIHLSATRLINLSVRIILKVHLLASGRRLRE